MKNVNNSFCKDQLNHTHAAQLFEQCVPKSKCLQCGSCGRTGWYGTLSTSEPLGSLHLQLPEMLKMWGSHGFPKYSFKNQACIHMTRKLVYTDIPRYKTVLTNPAQEQRSQVLGDQALHPATCKAALCHEPVRSPWGRFASAWAQQGWQVDSKLRKFLTPKKVLKYKIFASSSMEHFDFECCIFKPSHRGSVMMI